jgi:ribosome maturation factor RimP
LSPFFICGTNVVANKLEALQSFIAPAVEALGYEFWGCEYHPQGRFSLLRVYIDSPGGITVDDCAKASAQISAVLDVEDPIQSEYDLEVSSPGLERPLFTVAQANKFITEPIFVRLRIAQQGRRNFTGILQAVAGNKIIVNVDNNQFEFDFVDIDKMHLIANWPKK